MAIEALESVGAVYQASSTPEVAKETSQPKTQIIDIQTGAGNGSGCGKSELKRQNEQQGSGQSLRESRIRKSEKSSRTDDNV